MNYFYIDKPLEITVDFGNLSISGRCHHETYDGTYEVTPPSLTPPPNTHAKLMTDDLTVRPIEVSRTSNPQGGNTIFIGGTE